MKTAVLMLLLCLATGVSAQELPELVELDTEALEINAWQDLQRQLSTLRGPLRLDARAYLSSESDYSLNALKYRLQRQELLFVHRRDWNSDHDLFSFNLRAISPRLDLALGNWRLRFGRGMLLGDGQRSATDSLFSLREPLSPQIYVPLGLVGLANYGVWRLGAFTSSQMRQARLADSLMHSLPSSRGDGLVRTRESLAGLSLGYLSDRLHAAALLYWQQYDRAWSDAEYPRSLLAGSLSAALEMNAHRLDGELALLEWIPYGLIAWRFKHRHWAQTVSFARNAPLDVLPYAISASRLSSAPGRHEYAWELGFDPWPHTKLQVRYSLNSGSGFSGDAVSRLSAALRYSLKDSWIHLTGHSFDRDLITRLDSTYDASLPRNYRLLLNVRHSFHSSFFQQLDLLWSLADRASFTSQTYRFRLSLGYGSENILGFQVSESQLRAGLLSWQSPRSFLAGDEFDPQYYSLCENEDTVLFAAADLHCRRWQGSLYAQRSLFHPRDLRLNLRLGLALL